MRRRAAGVLVAWVALVAAPADARADAGARIVGVTGDVHVESPGGTVAARVDAVVAAGDRIVTGERSSASLRLGDGSLLVLGERTRLRMTRALADAGSARDVSLLLEVGSLVARVARVLGVGGLFEVQTPSERVRVRAGELYLEVAPDGTTRIEPRTAEVEPGAQDDGGGASSSGPSGPVTHETARVPEPTRAQPSRPPRVDRGSSALSRAPVAALVPDLVDATSAAARATLAELLGAAAPALTLVEGVGTASLPAVRTVLDAASLPGGARGAGLPLSPALGVRAAAGGSVRGTVEFR